MALIYDGNVRECDWDVVDWHQHGLEFTPKQGHNRVRRQPPNLFVIHWTGGEGDCARIYRTLRRRKLGIHFTLDYDGLLYQHCDPARVTTAHCGRQNGRAIGLEVQSRGFPARRIAGDRGKPPKHADNPRVIGITQHPQFPRAVYRDQIHGKSLQICSFTVEQIDAIIALTDAFYELGVFGFGTDPLIPIDENYKLLRTTLPPEAQRTFVGVVGHYHLSKRKWDPGPQPLRALLEEGY